MNDRYPIFAYVGWGVIPRIAPSGMGATTKDYSGCILVFKSDEEQRLFGDHHVALFEMILRFSYERERSTLDAFVIHHQRSLQGRGGRVLSFGTQERALGAGKKKGVQLRDKKYYFVESQTIKLAESLFESIGCKVLPLSSYPRLNVQALRKEAHETIDRNSI